MIFFAASVAGYYLIAGLDRQASSSIVTGQQHLIFLGSCLFG
jgi:hypothetical protein